MLKSRKKAGQKQNIKIEDRSFQDVAKFKYFGTTLKVKMYYAKRLRAE
jgi:hypothetical protein